MPPSRLIASLLGPTMLAISAAIMIDNAAFRVLVEELAKSPALVFMTGLLTLLGGLAIVRFHNVWAIGWPLIVTVFGWAAVLGGLARMLFPRQLAEMALAWVASGGPPVWIGLLPLVLGAVLTWQGWRPGVQN